MLFFHWIDLSHWLEDLILYLRDRYATELLWTFPLQRLWSPGHVVGLYSIATSHMHR